MIVYLQNGCVMEDNNSLGETFKGFFIQELPDTMPNKYVYSGDAIRYQLDSELVSLYDSFQKMVFPNSSSYDCQIDLLPQFLLTCGRDADCGISKQVFEKVLNQYCNMPNHIRHLYLADCQYLIGSVQSLLNGMHVEFVRYFTLLPKATISQEQAIVCDGKTLCNKSEVSLAAASALESYFTKAYSILDVLTKLAYEIENVKTDYSKYTDLACKSILWGNIKCLILTNKSGTVYEKNELLNTISALRNEAVHNGAWELFPTIFAVVADQSIKERFMLFPDIEDGHLAKVRNRRHFFSNGTKVNDVLPEIHMTFQNMVLKTVMRLNELACEKSELHREL